MIRYTKGNLIEADAEALVNTVNTVGVMGKGIALQFKQAFPDNYKAYQKAFQMGELEPGKIFSFPTGRLVNPKLILNFPTKRHWRSKARLDDIKKGLVDLHRLIIDYEIQSIAIPPLGCGNGGLDWNIVKPLISNELINLHDVDIMVFEPGYIVDPEKISINTSRPKLTVGRAALILH